MKNKNFYCLLCIFFMSACSQIQNGSKQVQLNNSHSESSIGIENKSNNESEDRLNIDNKKLYYITRMEEARDKQLTYINSLPKDARSNVQTAYSAIMNESIKLAQEYPSDEALINQLVNQLVNESETKSDVHIKIEDIMIQYSAKKSDEFFEATPATARKYYSLVTPGQVLNIIYLNGEQIALKVTDSWQLGKGNVYLLHACYVNKQGTELVLFVEKDGKKLVFQSTVEPIDEKISVEFSKDLILNQYTK